MMDFLFQFVLWIICIIAIPAALFILALFIAFLLSFFGYHRMLRWFEHRIDNM